MSKTEKLKVAGDVNADPPMGIRDIGLKDFGEPLKHAIASKGAVGIGALAVGEVKSRLQHTLLKAGVDPDIAVSLDFRVAFDKARELV